MKTIIITAVLLLAVATFAGCKKDHHGDVAMARIEFQNNNPGQAGQVPIPPSVVLVGTGIVSLLLLRRRRTP